MSLFSLGKWTAELKRAERERKIVGPSFREELEIIGKIGLMRLLSCEKDVIWPSEVVLLVVW